MARILCVDDNPKAIRLKARTLRLHGHAVDIADSVEVALKNLAASHYGVVITDWRLGTVSAHEVVRAARLHAGLIVIVASGFTTEALQSPGPAADLYLDKPVDPNELVTIVSTLLQEDRYRRVGT